MCSRKALPSSAVCGLVSNVIKMNRAHCSLVVLVFSCVLQRTSAQLLNNITIFTNLANNIEQLGAHDDDVYSIIVLTCGVQTDPSTRLQHSWYVGDTRLPPATPDDRIFQQNGLVFRSSVRGTSLVLSNLSYTDSGQYRCESRGQSRKTGEVVSGSITITLKLLVRLEPVAATVQTFNDSLHVELGCEMAGYIHPDSDLYWSVNGQPVLSIPAYHAKYSISYANGSHVAQYGRQNVIPSRVAWLTVFNVEMEDSNMDYSCAIIGTDITSGVNLTVERASAPSAPPTNVTASATSSTSIRVNWSSVKKSERNGNITHYEIELSALNETKSVSVSFRERSMEVLELKEFTVYSVSMRAFTVIGPSPYSTPITVTTLEDVPSSPPQSVKATVLSPTIILVSWQPVSPREQNGIVTHYTVEFNQSTFPNVPYHQSVSTAVLSAVLVGLQEFVEYGIRVRAYTASGGGPFSSVVMATTLEDKPSLSPQILSLVSFNSSALGVSWDPPPQLHINGVLRHYVITVCSSPALVDIGSGSGSGSGLLHPESEEPDACHAVSIPGEFSHHILTNVGETSLYEVTIAAVTIAEGPSTSEFVHMGNSLMDVTPGSLVTLGPHPVFPLVSLTCSIALPTLTRHTTLLWQWRKFGEKEENELTNENRYEVFTDEDTMGSTLTVEGLRYSDSGVYECGVFFSEWDNVVVNSTSIILKLRYEINAPSPNVFLTKDTTFLHLECLLYGYTPSSELYWYREAAVTSVGQSELQRITNGVRHEADEKFQIQMGGRLPGFGVWSVLSLPFPTEVNAGRYLCALPGNLRENATIDVQLPLTEIPESDASGILIGVIVSVVVVLMVVMATVIAGWCFFHGCETKSSKSGFPNHPGPVDAQEEFVSIHSDAAVEASGSTGHELSATISTGTPLSQTQAGLVHTELKYDQSEVELEVTNNSPVLECSKPLYTKTDS